MARRDDELFRAKSNMARRCTGRAAFRVARASAMIAADSADGVYPRCVGGGRGCGTEMRTGANPAFPGLFR
jgi:hypothetical protein